MSAHLALVTLVVDDYDRAIDYFTRQLNFDLLEDANLGNGKRWVRVAPKGSSGPSGTGLLIAKATNPEQLACVGRQTGERVAFFLHTTDFHTEYEAMRLQGVDFIEQPRNEPYGMVVVFRDLFGNRWDLVGFHKTA